MTKTPASDNRPKTTTLAEHATLIFSAISTVFTLGWILWYCRYGIDLTDESFYLVWISNPFKYSISATQFGFIYHPLYVLLDGNIAALRQANILITFCLAWVLGNIFLTTVFNNQSLKRVPQLVISGAISTTSLTSLHVWVPTPSYNWLALQALLITAIGLLIANKKATRESIIGWLLIGVGGWLAFMAKPTTAAALGLCSGLYLLSAGKLGVRLLTISLATAVALLALSASTIDGSIITFIDRLKGAMEAHEFLGARHTLTEALRLDNFQLDGAAGGLLLFDGRCKFFLIAGTAIFFSAAYFSQAKIKALMHVGTMLSIAFAVASLTIVFGLTHKTLDAHYYTFGGLLLWSVPFAAILIGFTLFRFKGLFQISRSQWALALTFLTFPIAYAFGSNVNYWWQSAHAGIFWVLAGLVFLSPLSANRKFAALLMSFGLAAQLVTVALVQTGIEIPYRQFQPLREDYYKIEIGKAGSTLLLSNGFGHYFAEAINLANQAQFKNGTPMIDLSGQSPGILYAIGASNTGDAWIQGGWPGSNEFAAKMLERVSCEELSSAWLLVEPEGPLRISPEILLSFGANLATDFKIVGTFRTAEGAGDFKISRLQQFLKPVRSVDAAMTACAVGKKTKR